MKRPKKPINKPVVMRFPSSERRHLEVHHTRGGGLILKLREQALNSPLQATFSFSGDTAIVLFPGYE